MRKLNSLEKGIVQKLVDYEHIKDQGMFLCAKFLEEYYIGNDYNLSLAVSCKENKVMMLIPKRESDFENFKRKKIIFIVTFFNLLKDLEKEGKICLIGDNDKEGLLGPEFSEKVSFAPDIDKIICDIFFKMIVVSQDLIELVNNKFLTDEQLRHNQTLLISKIGIIVAVALGIISFVFSVIGLEDSNSSSNSVKIDSNQFQQYLNKQNHLIQNQHCIIHLISIKRDSINHMIK